MGEARAYETVCCEDLALTRHILYDFFQFSTIVVHDPSEILGKSQWYTVWGQTVQCTSYEPF